MDADWFRKYLIGFLYGLTCVSYANAQSIDSVQVIDEITVVANKYREVIPPQKLERKQIENLNSFSVADAVRFFAGVQIKDYGGVGGLKTVDVRSMGTHHMGVFYDGIQLGNAQNGQVDLGKFSLDNIEEIALYNGQKSEILQNAKDFGAAGTIYIKTRKPKFTQQRQYNLKATTKVGSFDLLNPSVLGEVKINEHVSATVNAEFVYSSGKYPFRYKRVLPDGNIAWDTTAVRQNGDIHSIRTEAGLFGITKHGLWQSKLYLYDSERGIPGAIVNNVWKRSQRQWDRNIFWQAGITEQWNERIDVIANIKVAADRMRYLNPDTTLMFINNHFQQLEVYVAVAHKYKVMNNWDVSLATDFQYNTLKANLQDFVYPVRYTALTAVATAATWKQVKAQASLLGSFVRDHFQRGQKNLRTTKQFDYLTPAAFLSYQPQAWKYVSLHMFAKQIFRMPTFNDLYYTDIGNADLQPEFTTQFDAGVQFSKSTTNSLIEHVEVKADAYYNQVTNKIIAVPKGTGQYRWMMMNLGYVEIKGLDVTAQVGWKVDQVRGATRINYTYQQAQDLSDPTDNDPRAGTYRRQIAYIPWHNGAVTTNLQWKQWIVNYSFVYVGERYHNSANVRENYEQPWYTHDMTISKEWKLKAGNHLKIALEVNNLLNQQYDVVLNYPMPGRNLKCILAWVL